MNKNVNPVGFAPQLSNRVGNCKGKEKTRKKQIFKKIIFLLIVFILAIFFGWGASRLTKILADFYYQRIVSEDHQLISAKARQQILEQKLKEIKPIRNRQVKDLVIEAKSAISVLIRPNLPKKILFEKKIDEKMPIASLVKLMTAYVVLKHYNLDYEIEISEQAILQPGTAGKLRVGQKLLVKDLVFPLLIESSNDAAFALAETIGQEEFVYLMNSEAKRLGLRDTYFANPTGLDPEKLTESISYSTLQDLVKFTKYLLNFDNNKLLWDVLSTKEIEIYGQTLINTNQLLNEIPGIVGGKTGWTLKAGGSLLLVFQIPQGYLINIILGSENRFSETKELKKWIYRAYKW